MNTIKVSLQGVVLLSIALVGFVPGDRAKGEIREGTAVVADRVPVVFAGGRETDPRDHGRPVTLVAGALGVPPEVFREAFSHVHPAGPNSGGPTPDEARQNKAALMAVLAPLGITNERLDTVSNYYRYVRSKGEMWPTKAATAYAEVRGEMILDVVVTDGGAGYSSPPSVTLPGFVGKAVPMAVTLAFSKEFEKNGSVSAVSVGPISGTASVPEVNEGK